MIHRVAGAVTTGPPVVPLRPRARRTAGISLLAVTAAGVALWLLASQVSGAGATPRLVIVNHEVGDAVYERAIEVGESFRLEHTHSVTRRPVVETFSVDDAQVLAIEELWFDTWGPNLPTGPEPIGDGLTTYLEEDDGYRVLHHGHPIGTVPIRVGSETVDHVLIFDDGERLRLLDLARAGAHVELTIRTGE